MVVGVVTTRRHPFTGHREFSATVHPLAAPDVTVSRYIA